MKNSKFFALCLSLVCAFVLAGVLVTTASAAPVTYYVGSADFEYQGDTHTPDYATVEAALTAMGTNGGTIIFTGSHNYLDTHLAKVNNAPYVTFIGADSTATLVISNKSYYHKSQVTYQHLTLQLPNSGGVYFLAGDGSNRSLTIGSIDPATGLGANDVTVTGSTTQFYLAGNAGWGAAEDVTINSGRYNYIGATYGNASAGSNSHITINGGIMPSKIVVGGVNVNAADKAWTHGGNSTLVLNGGSYNATQNIVVNEKSNHTTTFTGKTSVIINNGLADEYNFVISGLDYTVKSTADGYVELAAEGSATTAPTFKATAKNSKHTVLLNGEPLPTDKGVATFTPSEKGTYVVTYAFTGTPNPFTDYAGAEAGYIADTYDASQKTYAIVASVELEDWVDMSTITAVGFYGYTADSETAKITLSNAAKIANIASGNRKFNAVIYGIPTSTTEVVLKPFIVTGGKTSVGDAAVFVPKTINTGVDLEYYGPEDSVVAFFAG